MDEGKGPKRVGLKARRLPPDAARADAVRMVVYELLSLLRESAEPELYERLTSLMRRIPILASETDVAQALAEEDGETLV